MLAMLFCVLPGKKGQMLWKSSLKRATPLLRMRTSSLLQFASENSPCWISTTSFDQRSSAASTSMLAAGDETRRDETK